MSYANEKVRYIRAQIEAMAKVALKYKAELPPDFSMEQMTAGSDYAWHTQWKPISTRQGFDGGWDWTLLRGRYQKRPASLTVAMWTGPRQDLQALFVGRLSKTAATIDFIEGSPVFNHPLRGKVIKLAIEVATMYAQITGRKELWLVNPSQGLKDLYTQRLGFEYVVPLKGNGFPFCRREV